MTPEAADHLRKETACLERARTILAADVPDVAAREAYLAAFHAAQALILDRTGREAKTHRGVHVQFARLTRHEPLLTDELRRFLPRSYDMKSLADYSIGPDADVPVEQAATVVEAGERFVACVAALLGP
ncbi:MAG: HEPN domain-containing protein [Thiohalocapsa sp.]